MENLLPGRRLLQAGGWNLPGGGRAGWYDYRRKSGARNYEEENDGFDDDVELQRC